MTKICTNCNLDKQIEEFYTQKDRKNGSAYCKDCFNKYCIDRWQKRKIEAINFMGNKCADCINDYPTLPPDVFEFHHLNVEEKDFNWTKLRLKSWDKITKELSKCVMLCANCHRIRHYNLYWIKK